MSAVQLARPCALTVPDGLTTPVPRLPTEALGDIVVGLAQAEGLWRPHVVHHPHELGRVRLLATPAYEVWLLSWMPGHGSGLHDHGGANGAFVVVDGELIETVAGSAADHRNRTVVRRRHGAGSAAVVETGHVHDLVNLATGPATSLHVYSQSLSSMGFYDDAEPEVRGQRVRTLWVERETPRLADGPILHHS